MSRRKIGRTRERLSALLLKHGIQVAPEDLWMQEGAYRSRHWDGARWGSYAARFVGGIAPDGTPYALTLHLCCWDTMTECVRFGFCPGMDKDRSMGWGLIQLSANSPAT